MIDTTMTRLRSLVERTGIALFLVSHLKRSFRDRNHEEEQELLSDNCADLRQLLNSLMQSSDWNATNNPTKMEVIRQLESLKIAIQAKLA